MSSLYDQSTSAPTRKMQFVSLGGGIATLVVTVWAVSFPETYARVPPGFELGLGGLIATVFAYASGYYAKERAL